MQIPLPRVLATIGIVVAAFAAFSGPAQAQSSTPCSSRYQLAWEMPLRAADVGKSVSSVIGRSEFYQVIQPRGDTKRLAIGRAPDGTVGLQMNIPRGENASVSFSTAPFGSRGVDAACLSLQVYFEDGFQWPEGGTKMGWGLWGGSERDSAGGTTPDRQLGWTTRNVNTSYGFRLYSYHLNRPSRFGAQGQPVARWGSSDYRAGRWHKIEMEVVMNTVGKNDGYAQVWLDGKNLRNMTNLRFRNNSDWAIRGLLFNDMWGGRTNDPVNFSPKNQRMWYADYKLYRSGGSSVAQNPTSSPSTSSSSSGGDSSGSDTSSSQSSNASTGGAFGPVSPSGNVSAGNVVVNWRPDPKADRYYVRVIRTSDRRDMFGGSAWPGDCSGSLCSRSIGNLPRGSYEWFVRPQYGSKLGTYQSLRINVGDGGSTASTPTSSSDTSSSQSSNASSGSDTSSSQSSNASTGGAFGPVSPSGNVSAGNVVVNWRPDPKADRYYVRVIRTSDRRDMFGGSAWPGDCSGSLCSRSIGNLPRGSYEWFVRPQYGSNVGTYQSLRINVS